MNIKEQDNPWQLAMITPWASWRPRSYRRIQSWEALTKLNSAEVKRIWKEMRKSWLRGEVEKSSLGSDVFALHAQKERPTPLDFLTSTPTCPYFLCVCVGGQVNTPGSVNNQIYSSPRPTRYPFPCIFTSLFAGSVLTYKKCWSLYLLKTETVHFASYSSLPCSFFPLPQLLEGAISAASLPLLLPPCNLAI